ncbi:hypothetical protein CAQU_12645 [Corynebacterium aquilae DSM 44791]|uniref:Uncharacterized protein n=1 Tax=Corynebacterium aquilae DSM 44791 TaxID=1431546 RepID=A0A1L7CIR3_9CORY|nr:hypothetical protein CAQU_12645 [Corynebacterium aquilae DSM 44791]
MWLRRLWLWGRWMGRWLVWGMGVVCLLRRWLRARMLLRGEVLITLWGLRVPKVGWGLRVQEQ